MKKVWNTVRITKMWHRDTKWANDPGENGASRVATKFQFLKVATFVKHKKYRAVKRGILIWTTENLAFSFKLVGLPIACP